MFAGSLVALVTPMQPDGGIDFDAWSRLLDFHLENGTRGVVVAGTDRRIRHGHATPSSRELLQTRAPAHRQAHGC